MKSLSTWVIALFTAAIVFISGMALINWAFTPELRTYAQSGWGMWGGGCPMCGAGFSAVGGPWTTWRVGISIFMFVIPIGMLFLLALGVVWLIRTVGTTSHNFTIAKQGQMPCPTCGRPVAPAWVVCPYCGTPLRPLHPSQKEDKL